MFATRPGEDAHKARLQKSPEAGNGGRLPPAPDAQVHCQTATPPPGSRRSDARWAVAGPTLITRMHLPGRGSSASGCGARPSGDSHISGSTRVTPPATPPPLPPTSSSMGMCGRRATTAEPGVAGRSAVSARARANGKRFVAMVAEARQPSIRCSRRHPPRTPSHMFSVPSWRTRNGFVGHIRRVAMAIDGRKSAAVR